MPTVAYQTYTLDILRPAIGDDDADLMPITLSPGTYLKGARLAQITTATAQVQALSITGSPTGGTFTISGNGTTSAALAYNVSTANVQIAVRGLGGVYSGVLVTGTAGATYTITFPTTLGNVTLLTTANALTGGTTPATAVAATTPGVGPLKAWAAYSSGASDGRQTARMLLRQAVTVGDDGSISGLTDLDAAAGQSVVSAYYAGIFHQSDLSGITAGEITSLGGKILSGALADGDALIIIPD